MPIIIVKFGFVQKFHQKMAIHIIYETQTVHLDVRVTSNPVKIYFYSDFDLLLSNLSS